MIDIVIVGAGIAGITLARRYAEEYNKKVLIVERKSHIGGFCYDYRNAEGILVHKYGPHIFRTDSNKVYSFLSRFTKWYDYQHKVLAYVGGKYYPMPINLDTVNSFLNTNYSSDTVMEYFSQVKTQPSAVDNVKDVVESQVGEVFYKAFFEEYTRKQWGEEPSKLPVDIISRIPIRTNRDDRYFTSKYQGVPKEGYTSLFNSMLDHPNIKILLNTDFKEVKNEIVWDKLFYSGSIDEYFDYVYGRLPYRCVSFDVEEVEQEYYQPVAVVNYPNNYDYTRITDYKYFTKNESKTTVIAKEYPSAIGEPSYPIPLRQNLELYQKYRKIDTQNITFIGRLGKYKYYSMEQIVEEILEMSLI